MSNEPIRISRYIQLATKDALDKPVTTAWMAAVKRYAPSGVLATVQTTDDQGSLRSVCMVHREGKKGHAYRIPLTRDLSPDEVQKIVNGFVEAQPELDFDIETSESVLAPGERAGIHVDDAKHIDICTAMAKARHNKWMRERLNGGWRYGMKVDAEEKTHPLLRPWEQLPDEFRQPDFDSPQALLDVINSQGYVIVSKDELDRLKTKAKG